MSDKPTRYAASQSSQISISSVVELGVVISAGGVRRQTASVPNTALEAVLW